MLPSNKFSPQFSNYIIKWYRYGAVFLNFFATVGLIDKNNRNTLCEVVCCDYL